jgi:alkanesulfonate monooxygenase SsuD/methylene tetrahydromethanopterin reductase-like flavin-dependent oxidoreductase (luciferase family)
MKLGIGLWALRAPAAMPAGFPELYGRLSADARLAEEFGFESLWIAEHHFWYDGWCPAPLVAAAAVAAATSRLRVGTGIHQLPLHELDVVERDLRTLGRLAGGRLDYGVGLGYRHVEYDGYGVPIKLRGQRMDAALDRLGEAAAWVEVTPPPIWVGGFAPKALERAGSRGLGLLLPSTLRPSQLQRAIEHAAGAAAAAGREPGPVAVMKATLVAGSERERRVGIAHHVAVSREYTGAWYPLNGRPGFESPERLDAQIERSIETALIGTAGEVVDELRTLEEIGVDMVVLHILADAPSGHSRSVLERLGETVLPAFLPVST